jgi:hypothetical protein
LAVPAFPVVDPTEKGFESVVEVVPAQAVKVASSEEGTSYKALVLAAPF